MILRQLSFTFLALGSLVLSVPSTVSAQSWPAYRGPQGDGSTPEKIGNTKWSKDGPKQVWKAEATNGFSSFCVAEGKALTLVSREIDGVPTEVCLALDAATGKELWATPLKTAKYQRGGDDGEKDNNGGDGPRSTPTYANGHVYVLGANLDLSCLKIADGGVVWQKDIIADHSGKNISWSNAASPLVEGGMVYCAGGGEGQALLAFKADTGDVVWKSQDDKMTHATPIAATIHGQRQVIFYTQKGLVALEPAKGELLWRFDFPYRVSTAASPIVYEDMVYCAAGYGVGMGCAKISKNGNEWKSESLWRTEGDDITNHWSTPFAKDGYLYGMFSFKKYGKGPMVCLEMKSGEVKWKEEGFGAGNAILAGDHILGLSDRGELVVVEAKPNKYKEVARADVLEGKCWSTPVLAGGKVYARSTKQAVCLDLAGK